MLFGSLWPIAHGNRYVTHLLEKNYFNFVAFYLHPLTAAINLYKFVYRIRQNKKLCNIQKLSRLSASPYFGSCVECFSGLCNENKFFCQSDITLSAEVQLSTLDEDLNLELACKQLVILLIVSSQFYKSKLK